jgi:hypothetical protein
MATISMFCMLMVIAVGLNLVLFVGYKLYVEEFVCI